MESPSSRFTAAEGGTRLAAAARERNCIVAEHTSFVATRLLHEEAHRIRGPRSDGYQRSVYVTRPRQVPCVAYHLTILTDLAVLGVDCGDDARLSPQDLDQYQVLVCSSAVARRALEEEVLTMAVVNVLIIDSCHLICKDDNLKHIMSVYKAADETKRPRILALTYPLFISTQKERPHDFTVDTSTSVDAADSSDAPTTLDEEERSDKSDQADNKSSDSNGSNGHDSPKATPLTTNENEDKTEEKTEDKTNFSMAAESPPSTISTMSTIGSSKSRSKMGEYENYDDFKMYEKFEWKLDELERELCCSADLAEDIDGVKRISVAVAKPKELIIEFKSQFDESNLSEQYRDLEKYMRDTVNDAMDFLEDHRYDPTEIYGEDMYEEFKNIPDPTIEPKKIYAQFLYVLDELGPYGADKAALSLLLKLEKQKIKVPYERHFLLLCKCSSVLVKVRCYADYVLAALPDEWARVRACSTPKLLRFIEILTMFQPKSNTPGSSKTTAEDTDQNSADETKALDTSKLLNDIEKLDFLTLYNKMGDTVNTCDTSLNEMNKAEPESDEVDKDTSKNVDGTEDRDKTDVNKDVIDMANQQASQVALGFSKRLRQRGRSRVPRQHAGRLALSQQNPDSLCGIVFMREPLLAKILFMLITELSHHCPPLNFICAQYSAIERPADPLTEPREFEQQRKKQEEVLKNFRMHECNLLLATSALEEGIDLPRCNLVLRWDEPSSFRSYGLCRGRARAPRSACVLLARRDEPNTQRLLHHLATYRELDQIVSRKCGCGAQLEPPQSEEEHADTLTHLVAPYSTAALAKPYDTLSPKHACSSPTNEPFYNGERGSLPADAGGPAGGDGDCDGDAAGDGDVKADAVGACVDLGSAIALINRYCVKLPSDTFTRLAPQCWTEEVYLPARGDPGQTRRAYVCTMRLPLNCPVKYNIVGHPMPTRTLARRMVALQACRILHKSGELDNQLMPIGKDNFKSAELEATSASHPAESNRDPADLARPGTTKRRQYYFKRTARAFSDCQPVVDATDEEVGPPPDAQTVGGEDNRGSESTAPKSTKNVLYAIVYTLQCALPERYNTRGRRLHAPQSASQALALLTKQTTHPFQIPAFPVYTRSGEVRVSLERVADADSRVSPRRARLVRAFMRFVFAEVLRVRRRGMRLLAEPRHPNNYYIVPTIKTLRDNGTTKIDIDWAFLETIYKHTVENKLTDLEKPFSLNQDEADEDETGTDEQQSATDENRRNTVQKTAGDEKVQNNTGDDKQPTKQAPTIANGFVTNRGTGVHSDEERAFHPLPADVGNGPGKGKARPMANPLLKPGETFHFDADKYREAVVTPWYRNQDQPQYFLVAEICWNLSPDSAFPSSTHSTFRDYYESKYGVTLTQSEQPLLDVDHTSARLNLLTPRYVNRKGVALPVSSERTRRAKRDRLDQKQILVPELCRVHPFAAPLWFATVALPCVLYRINALLIADEIRQAVALEVGLGIPRIDEASCPGFQWPPLDFGWSLAEVLNADSEKGDTKLEEDPSSDKECNGDGGKKEMNGFGSHDGSNGETQNGHAAGERTINDILQEKEDAHGFEIGIWSNDMAASVPAAAEYDPLHDPLPANLTFCTSASGGTNWCDPVKKPPPSSFNPSRAFSVADSDCSYMTSDFDTDDSDLNSVASDEDTDSNSKNCNAAMGVRIEYKTAHEAEAVDLERKRRSEPAPEPDPLDELADRAAQDEYMRRGDPPPQYIERFQAAVASHKQDFHQKGLLIRSEHPVCDLLPEAHKPPSPAQHDGDRKHDHLKLLEEIFPYGEGEVSDLLADGEVTLEKIEKHKRELLEVLRKSTPTEEINKLNCFSMRDVDIDSPNYVNEKIVNIGFDSKESYMERVKVNTEKRDFVPYYEDTTVSNSMKDFDFDYQPDLEGHPGPSPSLILQALTMSNANDGINLERLETIGDSFLKFAITAYLYCAHPAVHEGKLSHMRSKHVSNLNLYRLGRNKRLGTLMIASKFEPHDNWLPPCHKPPQTLDVRPNIDHRDRPEHSSGEGCFIPYNLITQHSIPDKSIADCVEALIGAYLLSCGGRGALLFMSWLGLRVLPRHEMPHAPPAHPERGEGSPPTGSPRRPGSPASSSDEEGEPAPEGPNEPPLQPEPEWRWGGRAVGSLRPYRDPHGNWRQPIFGELKAPPSPLLRYIEDPEGELEQMLSGYDALERTLQYRFRDRSLLLQALTHASHQSNRLTDCYQRLEFLGDAILDYLITRHLYEDSRRHSPGALTDLRSALVNNTIFATLAVRHGFHKYFRHMSPGLNDVLTKYVKIQEENGHSISEEHYLIQEDEMEQAEDVEVPKALGDLFESVAGAIFLDSGMSLGAVWRSYVTLMGAELEAFSAAAPKSPVRELLEAEPDTAKFGKPERLADGRRVRVCVEVFGRGQFKGIGRNYRIAKGTAARCALRHLKIHRAH